MIAYHKQQYSNAQRDRGDRIVLRPRSASPLPLRHVPACTVLLRCLGGFDGGLGVTLPRRSCVLCGGCGGVLGGQSVQDAAAVFGQYGLLKKDLKLLLGQRDDVGQQLLNMPHAFAAAVPPERTPSKKFNTSRKSKQWEGEPLCRLQKHI